MSSWYSGVYFYYCDALTSTLSQSSIYETRKAAFHGSADAAKVLLSLDDYDGIALGLHEVVDKEGKTAVTHAKAEGNDDVAKVIEEAVPSDSGDGSAGEGLRKRK